jgi:hypothetical protein
MMTCHHGTNKLTCRMCAHELDHAGRATALTLQQQLADENAELRVALAKRVELGERDRERRDATIAELRAERDDLVVWKMRAERDVEQMESYRSELEKCGNAYREAVTLAREVARAHGTVQHGWRSGVVTMAQAFLAKHEAGR